mmetsp:Transcript_45636/g.97210  ORF Transcript_45636/g.97210 Transcript_45636/m.97210 type:complete len:350 (-) Transcript_45636:109-1158(-)
MEEARVKQLRQVRDDAQVDQLAHVVRSALAQFLAVDPLRHVNATGGDLGIVARDLDAREHAHVARDADAISALELIVELAVEVSGELVKQRDDVDALSVLGVDGAQELPRAAREVQVERDGLEHEGPLHLNCHLVATLAQRRLVHLPERRGGHRLGRYGGEDLAHVRDTELVTHALHRDGGVVRGHLVAQLLQLHHRLRREDVRPDRQRLPQFDIKWAERDEDVAQAGDGGDLAFGSGCQLAAQRAEKGLHDPRTPIEGELPDACQHCTRPLIEVGLERRGVVLCRQAIITGTHLDYLQGGAARGIIVVVDIGAPECRYECGCLLVRGQLLTHVGHRRRHVRDGADSLW